MVAAPKEGPSTGQNTKPSPPNLALKAKYAFYSTLVFFLIANPETFKMTQSVIGGWLFTIADAGGCPTAGGFFLHTALFFFVLWGAMLFPRDPG
jgi:hypothetical protein